MKKIISVLFFFGMCVLTLTTTAQEKEEKKKEERPTLPTDVPVTKPLAPTKGTDDPPVVPKETPQETPKEVIVVDHALLPPTLIKNIVTNVKVGQNVYVGVQALKVDTARKTWLQPMHITGVKSGQRVVSIKREEDGFHVVIERVDHQWEAEDFDGATQKWIPVRSLKVKE